MNRYPGYHLFENDYENYYKLHLIYTSIKINLFTVLLILLWCSQRISDPFYISVYSLHIKWYIIPPNNIYYNARARFTVHSWIFFLLLQKRNLIQKPQFSSSYIHKIKMLARDFQSCDINQPIIQFVFEKTKRFCYNPQC